MLVSKDFLRLHLMRWVNVILIIQGFFFFIKYNSLHESTVFIFSQNFIRNSTTTHHFQYKPWGPLIVLIFYSQVIKVFFFHFQNSQDSSNSFVRLFLSLASIWFRGSERWSYILLDLMATLRREKFTSI